MLPLCCCCAQSCWACVTKRCSLRVLNCAPHLPYWKVRLTKPPAQEILNLLPVPHKAMPTQPPILDISLTRFIPQTYANNCTARKIKLRDAIKSEIPDLSYVQRNSRGKKLSLDVCFNLFNKSTELGRKDKDLDNMLKILLDTLPDYMDRAKKNEGLGLVPEDHDDLIFHIDCRKNLVADDSQEGIDLRIFEFAN